MKRWTMPDGRTRNACAGPWVSSDALADFLVFCARNGHETRGHTGIGSRGYQIRHQGHWMGLLWNKNTMRYTADRRLSLLVQSFSAERAASQEGGAA